jgi:uncharacterized protein YcbX
MLRLSALYRYPLKSGKGEILQSIELDKLGLAGDRRWMLVDEASGRFLTQRAEAKMSQLSALWNAGATSSASRHVWCKCHSSGRAPRSRVSARTTIKWRSPTVIHCC